MGGNHSKQERNEGRKRKIYRVKLKLPKSLQKFFKKKEKYCVIEDEVDSAVPYVHDDNKGKADAERNIIRGISVEANEEGELEVFIEGASGFTGIPSASTEWDGEGSYFSLGILDSDKDQLSTPVSLEGNPFDRSTVHTPDSALDVHYSTDSSADDCQQCKAKNTEYMVQVFLKTLQRHLNVKEILPYLHFIDDCDARTLSITEPQHLAVEMLIGAIKKNAGKLEQGKWTVFLNALKETENIYLFKLLTGETEKDHHFTTQILKFMTPSLINDICLMDVLDLLLEKNIINVEDQCQIESACNKAGPIQAVRVMLEKVDKRLPHWYTEFADVLHKAGMSEIARVFKMIEYHEHVTPDANDTVTEKPHVVKRHKRKTKTAKRGKCKKHNQLGSACATSQSYEPVSKRMRKNTNEGKEDGGTMNMAFSMSSIGPTVENEIDELKKGMAELQKLSSSIKIVVENNQSELMKKIDALTNILAKVKMK